jgi:hypothetical protein
VVAGKKEEKKKRNESKAEKKYQSIKSSDILG